MRGEATRWAMREKSEGGGDQGESKTTAVHAPAMPRATRIMAFSIDIKRSNRAVWAGSAAILSRKLIREAMLPWHQLGADRGMQLILATCRRAELKTAAP
jgi:hypothetical protein